MSKFIQMTKRLPQHYIPTHYDLFLHITENQVPFDASVTITFQKNENSSQVYLNIHDNISIKAIIQNNIPLKYDVKYPILTINQSNEPEQDFSSYPITINYTITPITTNRQGFYKYQGSYLTKFEPNYARMLLPCFDDPSVRSTFSVKIRIPSNLIGLSNMPIETKTTKENETEIKFQTTPSICTYLLAIFVGDFTFIEGQTKNGVPVKMYAENGRHKFLKKFLDAAIFALEWMEEKTGVKYELPLLQLLSHPGIKSGMENYGLIALRDYTKGDNFVYNCLIVMHEVSHLWFGDLVSIKWWNSVWLNEGFAQYIMYPIFCDFEKEFSKKESDLFIQYDGFDCLNLFDNEKVVVDESEIDLDQNVLRFSIYIKGAFVLKMFINLVGEVNFFKVCSNWLNKYKNKSADVDEFIDVVNNTLNNDYSNFFNTWLKKIGYPLLNINEVVDDKDQKIKGIKIEQTSFDETIYQFKIPIVYEINGEIKKIDLVMNEKEKIIELDFDWVMVNDNVSSLCAVMYSKSLIQKLATAYKNSKIDQINYALICKSIEEISKVSIIDQEVREIVNNFND